jgi:hypothetical protein
MKSKITPAMLGQLKSYLDDVRNKGEYWGNKEQFWVRHNKIVDWIHQKVAEERLKK